MHTRSTRSTRLGLGAASLIAVMTLVAGCSLLNTPKPQNTNAANDAAAAKMVACLNQEGQTAKILHGGMVGILMPEGAIDDGSLGGGGGDGGGTADDGGGDGGGHNVMTAITKDDDGEWQASSSAEGYPEDGGIRDAWKACEKKVPTFKQPQPDTQNATNAQAQIKLALKFAKCARENGYADFPDPGDDGSMKLPSDITQDGFRTLLEDCFDPSGGGGFMIDKDTADSLNFSLKDVLDDFFAAHPEFQGPAGGQHLEGGSTGHK